MSIPAPLSDPSIVERYSALSGSEVVVINRGDEFGVELIVPSGHGGHTRMTIAGTSMSRAVISRRAKDMVEAVRATQRIAPFARIAA